MLLYKNQSQTKWEDDRDTLSTTAPPFQTSLKHFTTFERWIYSFSSPSTHCRPLFGGGGAYIVNFAGTCCVTAQ